MTDFMYSKRKALRSNPEEDTDILPPHISLDEVDDFEFRPYQMPPVIDDPPVIGESLDDLILRSRRQAVVAPDQAPVPTPQESSRSDEAYKESLDAMCRREIQLTWRSIREGGEPRTILHALVLRDYLSVAHLASILPDDIPEIELRTKGLVEERVIGQTTDDLGQVVFFLPGLTA